MKNQTFLPIYQPSLSGNEKLYVNQCLDTNWISSKGEFINRFETSFAQYINTPYATSVSNGTVALHFALLAIGISPGDEIIVPSLTYVASVNTIIQAGAIPVFVDSLAGTWQIDPTDVQRKITSKTRAIMAVHLYGHPCDMSSLVNICKEHQLLLIEDCAEALGSFFHDQHVGTFGDVATFSFFGNKTITTGEGGMVVAKDPNVYERATTLKSQGVSKNIMYWHDVIAYNYRMTNICAAIGLAQLERVNDILAKKRAIAAWYKDNLSDLPLVTHEETAHTRHSYWMCSILLNEAKHRDPLRQYLDTVQIETRPLFYPAHLMPMYGKTHEKHPIAESLGSRGINLPSWPELTIEQLTRITHHIKEYFA